MNRTIIGIVIAIFIVGGAAFYFWSQQAQAPTAALSPSPAMMDSGDMTTDMDSGTMMHDGNSMMDNGSTMVRGVIVEITADGFSPQTVTIKAGTRVMWINKTMSMSWPATAMHPTHTVYPGSDIKKCNGSADESGLLFDACHELKPGESFSFVFHEKGTWAYHDHVRTGRFGKVIVE